MPGRDKHGSQNRILVCSIVDGALVMVARHPYPQRQPNNPLGYSTEAFMRLILKIDSSVSRNSEYGRKFAESVTSLRRDGHHLAIVQGDAVEPWAEVPPLQGIADPSHDSHNLANGFAKTSVLAEIGLRGWLLAGWLTQAGVPSLGLCCNDGSICQLRKHYCDSSKTAFILEAARVNPHWIDIICKNGAVPVISNVAMGHLGGLVDADQMAAACAIDWHADALIYISDSARITDATGTVIRWLEVERINSLLSTLPRGALPAALLNLCKQALEKGVQRVRILPVSCVELVHLFYFSRIEHGTEVVKTAGVGKPVKEETVENVRQSAAG